jgi:hypothetical protein
MNITYNFIICLFLLPLIVICVFYFTIKEREHKESNKQNILINILGAIFIDFMFCIFIFGIISVIIAVVGNIKLYYYFISLFIVIVLSINVFFTSFGFKIMKIFCHRFQFPILINNAFYIFTLLFSMKINRIWLYIIIGLYIGIDSLFILIKERPFIYFVFKIKILSCARIKKNRNRRYNSKVPDTV